MTPQELAADLRSRINPLYADQIGTESYERRLCAEAIESLLQQCGDERKKHEACVTINERLLSDNRILTAQRDELQSALEGVLPFLTGEYWPGVVADAAVDFAVAVVRKAEAKVKP